MREQISEDFVEKKQFQILVLLILGFIKVVYKELTMITLYTFHSQTFPGVEWFSDVEIAMRKNMGIILSVLFYSMLVYVLYSNIKQLREKKSVHETVVRKDK